MAFRTVPFAGLSSGSGPLLIVDAQPGDVEVWIFPHSNVRISGSNTTLNADAYPLTNGFNSRIRPGDEIWGVTGNAMAQSGSVLIRSA